MKKSLIALAVLGFAGGAMAQSTVTLYGIADVGIGKIKGGPALGDNSGKVEMISGSFMNNTMSRLGVRGVEDLGGGLKAGFNFETGLDLDTGAMNSSGGQMWGRAANLSLGGSWGTFTMGRQVNPSTWGVAAWELTGLANYNTPGSAYNYAGSGTRNNSQFSYKTPDFSGFTAELGYVFKNDNGGKAKWDMNAIYKNGPLGVGLSANKTSGGKTGWALGGKYNFGGFAAAASYNNAVGVRKGFSIGGQAYLGAFTVTLDVTRDTKNAAGKKTNYLLEGKYALSKRTSMYAAFFRFDKTSNYGLGVRHNF